MDNMEKFLNKLFRDNPQVPKRFAKCVDNTLDKIKNDDISYNEINKIKFDINKKYSISKLVAGFALGIISITGTVYASTVLYNKIWKNPEKYSYTEEKNIETEEKNNTISEEDAISIAMDWFEKLGYSNTVIEKSILEKDPYYDKIYWNISATENYGIKLNATDGSIYKFGYGQKIPTNYVCNKEQAIEIANQIYKELGFKENDYVLANINGVDTESDGDSFTWSANFYKMYDNIYNEYQRISMEFIPQINQIITLNVVDNPFENNPVILTEEEAITIAKQKDRELNKNNKIKNVLAKLKIVNMNEYIYVRENNLSTENQKIENADGGILYYNQYKDSKIYRKAYGIYISYEDNEIKDIYTEYYIDATTGEIIGGQGANLNEQNY